MNSIRRELIRSFIERNQVVTMLQLKGLLPDVSLMTIHRDLNVLQEQGFVQKIRGGAKISPDSAFEPMFSARENINQWEKQTIATKAVSMLGDSSSIFMDAGTTMMALATAMPDNRASIITTGPNIAIELAKKQSVTVSLCGGTLNKNNMTLSGANALELMEKINIDTAFVVASGFSFEGGFTCGKQSEAQIKRLVIGKARVVAMLMDSSKIDRLFPYTFCDIKNIHYFITEKDPLDLPQNLLATMKSAGIFVL